MFSDLKTGRKSERGERGTGEEEGEGEGEGEGETEEREREGVRGKGLKGRCERGGGE